jgi:hypothetical protein
MIRRLSSEQLIGWGKNYAGILSRISDCLCRLKGDKF